MKRRSFFPILVAAVASPFLLFQESKARPKRKRLGGRIWGKRKTWLGVTQDFNDPNNWEPYGVPRRGDTIVVYGGELRIPAGRKFKRLEVHSGIVTVDNDSCGNHCCFDEIWVPDATLENWELMQGCRIVVK